MKPFNLEEFKSGKKAVTRDGKIAICGGHNPQANKTYEVVGWVNNAIWCWNEKGQSFEDRENYKDLIGMAPEKKTVWVNVYDNVPPSFDNKPSTGFNYGHFKSEEDARKFSDTVGYKGTFPLEIEV